MEAIDLSSRNLIRDLLPADADMVYKVLKNNTIFYKYHPPMVTVESILEDMEALPPNKGYEDKHYIGFFYEDTLAAVMNLIEHTTDTHIITATHVFNKDGSISCYATSFIRVVDGKIASVDDDIYDVTNRFYFLLGFKELEVFPTLWDECNPCQIYIMAI